MAATNFGRRLLTQFVCCAFLLALFPVVTYSQTDTTQTINKKRLKWLVAGTTLAYTGTMIGLSSVWYSQYDKQSFHFFNDWDEWKQMDKAGHLYSAFQVSSIGSNALLWSGVSQKKSDLWGSVAGFAILSSIEVLDGFSAGYGASASDLGFNALGAGFYLGQKWAWKEIRIYPKFSFHTTSFASQRPETLGGTLLEQLIKDYNGQTYWLSVDIDKFVRFPGWLNLSIGYGAENMIYAHDEDNEAAGLHPYRQFYISLDFDATAIHARSPFVKSLLYVVNMIKIPGPTLEFSQGKVKGYFLYF